MFGSGLCLKSLGSLRINSNISAFFSSPVIYFDHPRQGLFERFPKDEIDVEMLLVVDQVGE